MTAMEDHALSRSARWGQLAMVVGLLLLVGFFSLHQARGTGFLTDDFGPLETIALFVPIFLAMVAPVVTAARGHENPGRPWEVLANLALAAGSYWLWRRFPFNFAHLGDVFPQAARFLFGWITDNIGRVILVLQIIASLIGAPRAFWQYYSTRRSDRTSDKELPGGQI